MKEDIRFSIPFLVATVLICLMGISAAIAQPANDNCADAVAITYGNTSFNTTGASIDGPDEPSGCNFNSFTQVDADIWYTFIPTNNCVHTFSLCGSSYDTKIAIYDGTAGCPTSASVIACNDDFCGSQSQVAFNPITGRKYFIRVGGNSGASGAGTLAISAASCNPPTFNGCPSSVTLNNNNNQCTSVYNWTAPTANDNTGVTGITSNFTPPVAFPVGTSTVTYIATDTQGNTSSCSFTVTVNDVQSPVLTGCPSNIVKGNDPNMCTAIVSWTPPTPADNCPAVTMTSTHNPGSSFVLGTTQVTYTATDAHGNSVSCSFNVTVNDTQNPVITCPGDTVIGIDPGMCGAVFTYTAPVGTDNCPGESTTKTDLTGLGSGDFFPLGNTTLEYTVNDAHGHSSVCSFTITVVDDEDPVISCPTVIPACSPDYTGAVMTWVAPVGTDNCPGSITVQSDASGLTAGDVFPPGTTTIEYTVTDTAGNSASCSFDVVVYPKPLAEFSFSQACQGQAIYFTNQTSVLTGNIVSYQWNMGDGGGTITQVNPIHFYPSTGNYTVTLIVTTENGCMDTVSHVVTVTENPTALFTVSPNVCLGGSVSFTNASTVPVSYLGGLNYSWDFGDGNSSTAPSPTHVYNTSGTFTITLTATTDDGCDDTYTKTVTIYPVPSANFTVTNPCLGEPTQFSNFSNVGSGTITYQWDFGDGNTSSLKNPSHTYATDGVYTVTLITVSDHGCTDTVSNTVTLHPIPVAAFTTANACEGIATNFTNGSSITTGTINFNWEFGDNSSSSSYNPTHLYAQDGTYTIFLIATSTFGCADTVSGTVEIFPTPEFSLATDSVVCHGDSNGAVTATVTVGLSPYTYQLDNGSGQSSNMYPNLPAGTYTVKVTDSNTCFASHSISVGQPSAPVSLNTVGATGILCHGDLTGSIDVAGSGGTPAYQFSLDGGSFQADGSYLNLPEGDYVVVIQDARACTDTLQINLSQPDTLVVAIDSIVNVNCFGGTGGKLFASAIGGINPYGFSINATNFAAVDSFLNLGAGNYLITVKDFNGCLDTVSASITESSLLQLNLLEAHNVLCFGQSGGSISVVASGSVPTYTYSLNGSPYQQDSNFYALPAGDYTIEVKDANGCTQSISQSISEPGALSMSLTSQSVLCFNGNTGSIQVTASGGSPNYQYSINGGLNYFNSPTFSNLQAGSYVVSVRDTNGCSKSQGVVIQQPVAAVDITVANIQNVLCRDNATGEASFAATGGTGSYTFSIDTGQTWQASNAFTGLAAGTYNVMVRDVNACSDNIQFTISQPPVVLEIDTILVQNILCNGLYTGKITVNAVGGTPEYEFSKNGGSSYQPGNIFNNLAAGTYQIVLVDYNGCSLTQTVQITEPAALLLNTSNIINTFCEGDTSGVINVFGNGGVSPYSYTLNSGTPQSNGIFTGLTSGDYTVGVKDANNCSVSLNITVEHDNSLPVADFTYNVAGNSIAFNNTSQYNLTNAWSFGDGSSSVLPEPIHTYATEGPYSVKLVVTNVCGADSVIYTVVSGSTGVVELDGDKLMNIYPNPSNGQFVLELNAEGIKGNMELRVIDINGKVQLTELMSVSADKLIKNINLEGLGSGIYMLDILTAETHGRKIIVIHK